MDTAVYRFSTRERKGTIMRTLKHAMAAGILATVLTFGLMGCQGKGSDDTSSGEESATLSIAAAASLEKCYTEKLIPMFEKKHPNVKVEGTYDSSGKLQTQIEQGMDADVFMSAAAEQMDHLVNEDYISRDDVVDLLENKLVLIVPEKDANHEITSFKTAAKAETIAVGDPESVPAGQYAKEVFTNLHMWDQVNKKASFATNVTEVLNWVAKGSADCGIVYATDAASTDDVKVVAQAPEDALKTPVIYPAAALKESKNKDTADEFVKFLQSDEALKVFQSYGFTINQ